MAAWSQQRVIDLMNQQSYMRLDSYVTRYVRHHVHQTLKLLLTISVVGDDEILHLSLGGIVSNQ